MLRLSLIIFFLFLSLPEVNAQEFIPLWPENKMPNSKGLALKDSIANERIYQVGTPGMYAYYPFCTGKQAGSGSYLSRVEVMNV